MEFGGVSEPAYTLEETAAAAAAAAAARKGRDFSNPMYDAVTRAVAAGEPEPPLRKCLMLFALLLQYLSSILFTNSCLVTLYSTYKMIITVILKIINLWLYI